METLTELTTALKDGGPWALMSIAFVALAWLAKLYIKARDRAENELKEQAKGFAKLLIEMVRVGEKQVASGDAQVKASEAMASEMRGLTSGLQKVQEQQRRLLREAGLGDDT